MLNKVPEVTLYFWIIKVLCTTVGETAADYLNDNLGLGPDQHDATSWPAVLVVALVFQFRLRRYVAGVYWLAVVLISIVGTLITDNLTDNFGVSLVTTTIVFGVALAATFAVWYASERTLSIHTIVTTRREAFYWLAVLFTFALGTAAGDLIAERLALGYLQSALLFGGAIAVVYVAHFRLRLNAILAFWIAYILTRPLGASIGDYLSQPTADGGLGLGTTVTSVIFLGTILALVVYLTSRRSTIPTVRAGGARRSTAPGRARVLVVANKTRRNPARSTRSCASARPPARPSSSCSFPIPPTWRSTASPRTPRGRPGACPGAAGARASRPGARSRAGSPTAPTPSTTSWRRSRGGATTRSSSRPRRATSPTGCTWTSRSGSNTSATPEDGHGDALAAAPGGRAVQAPVRSARLDDRRAWRYDTTVVLRRFHPGAGAEAAVTPAIDVPGDAG